MIVWITNCCLYLYLTWKLEISRYKFFIIFFNRKNPYWNSKLQHKNVFTHKQIINGKIQHNYVTLKAQFTKLRLNSCLFIFCLLDCVKKKSNIALFWVDFTRFAHDRLGSDQKAPQNVRGFMHQFLMLAYNSDCCMQ